MSLILAFIAGTAFGLTAPYMQDITCTLIDRIKHRD